MVEHQPRDIPLATATAISDQIRAAVIDTVKAVRDNGLRGGDLAPALQLETLESGLAHACPCAGCQALTVLWVIMVVLHEMGVET